MAYIDNNRKEELKNWDILPGIYLQPQTITFYNRRIVTDRVDLSFPEYSIDCSDGENEDHTYVRYLMILCLNDYTQYTESMGVVLKYNEINIRTILNEIINGVVDERYYKNTIEFYKKFFCGDCCVINGRYYYKLMEQAVRFNDQKMIDYLIFKRQEDLERWFDDIVTYSPPDGYDEEEEYLEPPTIETGFVSDNCVICCLEKPNILNLPCLHISTCESCEKIGELTKCSICRMVIQKKVKI